MTDQFRPVAATCFWAGLRISEALALRWEHVDFTRGLIFVPGTKTESSEAPVKLQPALARELLAHRQRQGQRGFDRIRPEALIFQTMRGKTPGRRNVLRALQTACKAAGLVKEGQEPIGLHDLRHSLAAHAFELGLTAPEVATLLRHANARVTLTIYAGIAGEDVAERVGDKLAAAGFGL